ncbi:hypothetical protein [Bacteroides hominis]|jgi:hypothetical protein|uniref:hypothetical protein n=1 Tax=Bacteroides hominis TaxID=2763023 RepID=UPI00164BD7AE|nr:hypothetical protein [Bacteroides hominis (ex Liu et al. 2022)]MBC5614276.1 hypothetical protein [Bacteroides hominis (ex Liu et al. 2022)]MCS2829697.1 hypothetical protein [Bacteroides fragilis]
MEHLTHWKSCFNYKYLGIQDLPDGKDIILTIQEVKCEEVIGIDGEKNTLPVLYFAENVKPMVCGKRNSDFITQSLKTPYHEQWIGKQIQVGCLREKNFGKFDDYLRPRKFAPAPPGDNRPTVETGSAVWKNIADGLKGGYTINQVIQKYKLTKEQIKELQKHEIR